MAFAISARVGRTVVALLIIFILIYMYTVGYKSIDAITAQKDADQKATFLSHYDSKIRRDFKAAQELTLTGGKLSTAQQLREITLYLDPSSNEAVKTFYNRMPAAVREYDRWKRESARLIVKTTDAVEFLTMTFTGDYADEEVYEEFTSESLTNEVEQLRSEVTAHNKVIDGMKLAQDAARDFAWWEQFHKDFSRIGAAATSTVGSMGAIVGVTFGAPVLVISAPVVLPVVAFQLWFGRDRGDRNNKGKKNLTEAAITLSDIIESIQRDVRWLDEIGVYVTNIAKCQEKVRTTGRINKLQRDRIVHSGKKLEDACKQVNLHLD